MNTPTMSSMRGKDHVCQGKIWLAMGIKVLFFSTVVAGCKKIVDLGTR